MVTGAQAQTLSFIFGGVQSCLPAMSLLSSAESLQTEQQQTIPEIPVVSPGPVLELAQLPPCIAGRATAVAEGNQLVFEGLPLDAVWT